MINWYLIVGFVLGFRVKEVPPPQGKCHGLFNGGVFASLQGESVRVQVSYVLAA